MVSDGLGDFSGAVAALRDANGADPNLVEFDGGLHPRAQLQGDRAAYWIERQAHDEPSREVLLAAYAHHLRRWAVPRHSYPEGRAGYLRWRRDRKARHAEDTATILAAHSFTPAAISRVSELIRRTALATDTECQALEDAICLTFLETQFAETASKVPEDKMVDILAKTMMKMSAGGRAAAADVELPPELAALLARAASA